MGGDSTINSIMSGYIPVFSFHLLARRSWCRGILSLFGSDWGKLDEEVHMSGMMACILHGLYTIETRYNVLLDLLQLL